MRKTTALALALLATPASAQDMSAFETGPVFEDFGPHAAIDGIEPFAADTEFAHSFDVAEPAKAGGRNRGIESAARFINMHVLRAPFLCDGSGCAQIYVPRSCHISAY